MKKRLLCLLLAALMLLSMLTACSKPPAQEETPKDAPSESTDDPSAPASETSDEISPAPDLSGRTITLLTTDTWVQGITLSSILPRFQQIEERTGCKIVWETAPSGSDYDTVVQTRLTGDASDCPDVIMMSTSTSTLAKYIGEDLLYDITKAYDVCPNIEKFYNEYQPDLKGSFTYNDGGIYNLLANTYLHPEDQGKIVSMGGDNAIWYRADIAEKLGFTSYPKTIDELHDLLLAVKENYPDMIPMHMWDWSCWESARIFTSAYNLHFNNEQSGSFFYPDATGKVQYEPATEAAKEWLTEMHKWYEEGLIVVGSTEDEKIGAASNGILFSDFYANVIGTCEASAKEKDPDARFMYMPFPSKDGYGQPTIEPRATFSNSFVIVNNGDEEQCRAALQLLDYAFFSRYGICSERAGVEGEGWSFDENGNFVPNEDFIRALKNNEIVLQATGANIHINGPTIKDAEVEQIWDDANKKVEEDMGKTSVMSEEQKDNWKEINAINCSYYVPAYPTMYFSDEDLATYNALAADLGTFTDEMLEKFILGSADLANFQTEFVDVLYNRLHLQDALDIQQKYYDNYLANSAN